MLKQCMMSFLQLCMKKSVELLLKYVLAIYVWLFPSPSNLESLRQKPVTINCTEAKAAFTSLFISYFSTE